jgi:hypothetical protein
MRASVHVKLPNLTSDGSDARAKAVCKPLGLSVRGLGGEHTAIGADGTVDISPSARLMVCLFELTIRLKKPLLFAIFIRVLVTYCELKMEQRAQLTRLIPLPFRRRVQQRNLNP